MPSFEQTALGLGFEVLCNGVFIQADCPISLEEIPRRFNRSTLPHSETGELVWHIRPEPAAGDTLARSRTQLPFDFHTDASFSLQPPPYFAMDVVHGDELGGGVQSYLPLSAVLGELSIDDQRALRQPYTWRVPEEFYEGQQANVLPILFDDKGEAAIRLRADCLIELEECGEAQVVAVGGLRQAIARQTPVRHTPQVGEVILVDNRRVLHARSEVVDPNRHLRRVRFG